MGIVNAWKGFWTSGDGFAQSAVSDIVRPKRQIRAYQGAVSDRLTANWMSSQLSADAEIRGSLRKLRDRSREMVRNFPYAKQAKRTTQINVVGTGMKFQSLVTQVRGNKRDQRANKAIEEAWADWCRPENCDTAGRHSFHQFEWLATGALPESGEAIFRIVRKPFGTTGVPLALQFALAGAMCCYVSCAM